MRARSPLIVIVGGHGDRVVEPGELLNIAAICEFRAHEHKLAVGVWIRENRMAVHQARAVSNSRSTISIASAGVRIMACAMTSAPASPIRNGAWRRSQSCVHSRSASGHRDEFSSIHSEAASVQSAKVTFGR
jgi:hypothetical protein